MNYGFGVARSLAGDSTARRRGQVRHHAARARMWLVTLGFFGAIAAGIALRWVSAKGPEQFA